MNIFSYFCRKIETYEKVSDYFGCHIGHGDDSLHDTLLIDGCEQNAHPSGQDL
jgi:hypothetical protein